MRGDGAGICDGAPSTCSSFVLFLFHFVMWISKLQIATGLGG